jgi:hypothetical protein
MTIQSIAEYDGVNAVPNSITVDGLSLTPSVFGTVYTSKAKHELLHFGFTYQWHAFRRAMKSPNFFLHKDTTL